MKKKRKSKGKIVKILLCPRCKKASLEMLGGFITASYQCKKCGYLGNFVIEKDILTK